MAFKTMVGARIRRREDPRLITGGATYVDDVRLAGTAYAAFVRSPYGHAKIGTIDTAAAKAMPGVLAVYTAADTKDVGEVPCAIPGIKAPPHPVLAADEVCFVGEPVAVIVAATPYAARDALEHIAVEWSELPVVTDLEKAEAGAPFAHSALESNIASHAPLRAGDTAAAFAAAAVVVKARLVNQRCTAVPIEPRSMLAHYEPGPGHLTFYSSTQIPHLLRTNLAGMLGLIETRVRVIAPEVGGGFGAKLNVYAEEAIVAFASIQLGRPVKYVDTRSECFQAMAAGRDQIDTIEVAAKRDGTVTALRLKVLQNLGCKNQLLTPGISGFTMLMAPGCYKIANFDCDVVNVYTNMVATDAYRGAGRPEATYLIERAMDLVARELGMDPVDVRRKNFIGSHEFPHTTVAGLTYDSGQYETTMDKALGIVDYAGLRRKQEALRKEGRYLGIGLSTYVEVCGMGPSAAMPAPGWESATIRIEPTGSVTVLTGISPHGQGQETTFAQLVADQLGVPIDQVSVIHGDTGQVQYGVGTFGSRGTAVGGAALKLAINAIQAKAVKIAAHEWEANPDDVEYRDGKITVKGDPSKSMSTAQAGFKAFRGIGLPPGMEPGLDATSRFEPPNFVFPFGTHIAVVEVDPKTGAVRFERYVAVDDCGEQINPLIVAGQVHGGIAQGMAQALYEEVVYDSDGQLRTGTLLDYAVPHADQLPRFELDSTATPTTVNPLGIKGVGEAGTIGSTPAVVNAVIDALAPFGVKHLDMPLKPEKLWRAMQQNGATNGRKGGAQ
jgi:carbon-monoxide dehydrogenase large subunit